MRIAVDAMGGDNAPDQVLLGAAQAADESDVEPRTKFIQAHAKSVRNLDI